MKSKRNSIFKRTIIPIASGKGGVGKSFLAANLGTALAELGKTVIVADLDFGGSNLHTFLGINNIHPGIGDFLRARTSRLEDLVLPTGQNKLFFLAGDVRSPFLANMHHAQKMRLIYNLKQLDCEYLILDLGSGSSYNTLDYFAMTQLGLILTTTEHTSIMNLLTFLKHFAFRVIEHSLPKNSFLEEKLRASYNRSVMEDVLTVRGLLDELATIDLNVAQIAENNWVRYRPRIVFNKCKEPDELDLINSLENTLIQNLMLRSDFFGCLFDDPTVMISLKQRKALYKVNSSSQISEDIHLLADRIIRLWKQPLRNSADLLVNNSQKLYHQRHG
ncbi:MAG: P-loop NTPase [SAR324 cluster bacterium]|nr:P-loop NTPase [SAR324 cluster bacterium]MBL7035828.1 P-loop NTPase [SAR324 cluster bacterium]